ncbi:vomeronasal type-2 receptor 26-like [Mixophyes fleayi]|uniref:vomeronasal type-2 receptor 26-like n=1 Tax=Mixophyes fleayi TaxID=3061075 RepID=UPI003F4DFBA4
MPFHSDTVPPKITFTDSPPEDTCITFFLQSFQQYQAVRFALEEINTNPDILPNTTLGYHAFDSCCVLRKELEGTLWMVTGHTHAIPNYCCGEKPPLAGVLGHSMSHYSILMAHVLGLYHYPQISHYSTSALLSDRTQFPSFFRTVPSDAFQSVGLAQLVLHFGWTWVGLVGEGNEYGQQGIQVMKQEILKAGACVAFTEFLMLDRSIGFAFHSSTIPGLKDHLVRLRHYIQNVHVKLSNGREVLFDKNGDVSAVYDIVNWQLGADGNMKHFKVGSYDTAFTNRNIFTINSSAIIWPSGNSQVPTSICSQSCLSGFRKVVRRGEPACCFQCVPCSQGEISNQTNSDDCLKCPWNMWPNPQRDRCIPKTTEYLSYEDVLGATLATASAISAIIPASILCLFFSKKNTPIVRANNYTLSCLLLVSLSLCFLCSLVFIGYPQPEKCLMRQVAFGMVFSLCVSCILAKTIMVVFAFMATKPGSSLRKWTTPQVSYMIVSFCTLIQFILCILWMSFAPPFPENNIQTQPAVIIVECNENSPAAFWCMLGYLSFLATISFIVAFLARHLPDSFNEAKFITFSMLAFLSVWVSFIPASLSAHGKYTVAMEIFAILASSWALVICMFLPKCFIILFRPNKNSREHLKMGKS